MTDAVTISPLAKPLQSRIRPPGSKSLTNRALICAALAEGASVLEGALVSEDTEVMIAALGRLGVAIDSQRGGTRLKVVGVGGNLSGADEPLLVGNSGTTMRFLTAASTLAARPVIIDGVPRMRERPIGDLLNALKQLGADVTSVHNEGFPPVRVAGGGLPGGTAKIRGDLSSQFYSGLLLAAPYAQQDVELVVDGTLVSVPYVRMTLRVMQDFGVVAEATEPFDRVVVPGRQTYRGAHYEVEADASAASYFFAAAAVAGGEVCVEGLSEQSLQGDVGFCQCLAEMGCSVQYRPNEIVVRREGVLRGIDVDMNAISDTVQTLAVVALFAEGTTRIRNVAHIRHKETDRIHAVAVELRKLGATVRELEDGLEIVPGELQGAAIDTYDDHRMAMSFAVAGLKIPGVVINDPGCTAKTYPGFFEDFRGLAAGRS